MSNLFTEEAKLFKPAEEGDGSGLEKAPEEKSYSQLLIDSGLEDITKVSTPEQISEALTKFTSKCAGKPKLWLMSTQGSLTQCFKDRGIVGAAKIIGQAFKGCLKDADDIVDVQGRKIDLSDPEPWDHPVETNELLDGIMNFCKRFLILPDKGAVAMSLWGLFSWVINAFEISPYLVFTSPEKRCGKTTAMNLIGKFGPKGLAASSISPACLFRCIEKDEPTLLIDEADRGLKNSEDLNLLLNSGHILESAFAIRAEGDNHEPRAFSTWSPKVIAAIGRLKDTLEDRSIILQMRRRMKSETVERRKKHHQKEFNLFKRKCFRWAQDNMDTLRDMDPEVPEELNDRAADNWRPLLAIADLAGGEWPRIAREAAIKLSGDNPEEESRGVQLLQDVNAWFDERKRENFTSEEMCLYLGMLDNRPWPEYYKGKPLSKSQLAKLLKKFDIKPKNIKQDDGRVLKGYAKDFFKDAFSRYLPATAATRLKNKELADISPATSTPSVADEKEDKACENNAVAAVAAENPETWPIDKKNADSETEILPGFHSLIEFEDPPKVIDYTPIKYIEEEF